MGRDEFIAAAIIGAIGATAFFAGTTCFIFVALHVTGRL
jgi:hypothetical protein